VIRELLALNGRYENLQCSSCNGKAHIAINTEGVVIVCANGGCKKSKRVDAETLQRLADRLAVLCYSCKASSLKSIERTFANILKCPNPDCAANNTWQGISDKIDAS
jgi:hypothetical protein